MLKKVSPPFPDVTSGMRVPRWSQKEGGSHLYWAILPTLELLDGTGHREMEDSDRALPGTY